MTDWINKCHFGDCLETLRRMPDGIAQMCVTSPPYFGLRSYLPDGHKDKPLEIGLESTPDEYIKRMVEVFREVRRVLRDDGTCWVNIGDSYASSPASGCKPKDLIGIPWLLAFALRADGWYLRQEIIWQKLNTMPESVTDRCTKAHESIFLLSKSERYYFDNGAIKEAQTESSKTRALYGWNGMTDDNSNGARTGSAIKKMAETGMSMGEAGLIPIDGMRNKRSVWTVATKPFSGAHFACFPPALIEPCILAGAPAGRVVLDCFFGSGTTGQVAQALGRSFIGCELNHDYKVLQDERLCQQSFEFLECA